MENEKGSEENEINEVLGVNDQMVNDTFRGVEPASIMKTQLFEF